MKQKDDRNDLSFVLRCHSNPRPFVQTLVQLKLLRLAPEMLSAQQQNAVPQIT